MEGPAQSGPHDHTLLVFAEAQMIEQEIARRIAEHFMQCRPRELSI
jgi:hypothetical protein